MFRWHNAGMPSLTEKIEQNVSKPASMSSDGQSVSQHSLRDQIAADEYLSAKKAMKRRKLPLTFTRTIPGGAVQ